MLSGLAYWGVDSLRIVNICWCHVSIRRVHATDTWIVEVHKFNFLWGCVLCLLIDFYTSYILYLLLLVLVRSA